MRQKYIISIDNERNVLKISEYAIVTNIPKTATALTINSAKYSLLGEQAYDKKDIKQSISRGNESLIASLRTKNIFPIAPYASKIADAVTSLFKSANDDSVELLFNDVDLLSVPEPQDKEKEAKS